MTPLSTMPAGRLHGRDAELGVIRDEFGHLAEGTGAVVVVEGAAGMGKSRLLAEASSIARELGIRVGIAAADPGESVVELSALLSALSDGVEPLLDRRELTSLRAEPEQRFWVLRDLQALLERSALDSPLLIGIDDAHWADAGTAAALRTLPVLLSGLPIVAHRRASVARIGAVGDRARPARAERREKGCARPARQRGRQASDGRVARGRAYIAGNSDEAIAFADTVLRETLPAEQEAEVRLSIAGMFAISPEIRIAAGRSALTLPGLPAILRARHLACLFHSLVYLWADR